MDGAQPYADSSHRFGSLVVFPRTEEAKSRAAIPKKLWPDEAVRAAMGTAATAHSNRRTHPRLVGITRTLGAVSDPITAVAQLRHAAVSVSVAAVAELLDATAVRAVVHQPVRDVRTALTSTTRRLVAVSGIRYPVIGDR
jgi:hypothetical protein